MYWCLGAQVCVGRLRPLHLPGWVAAPPTPFSRLGFGRLRSLLKRRRRCSSQRTSSDASVHSLQKAMDSIRRQGVGLARPIWEDCLSDCQHHVFLRCVSDLFRSRGRLRPRGFSQAPPSLVWFCCAHFVLVACVQAFGKSFVQLGRRLSHARGGFEEDDSRAMNSRIRTAERTGRQRLLLAILPPPPPVPSMNFDFRP